MSGTDSSDTPALQQGTPGGPDAILEAAARWHAALDLGTADPEAFERWRAQDPRHAVAFARLAGLNERIEDAGLGLAGQALARPASVRQHRTTRRGMMAAGLAMTAGLGGWAVLSARRDGAAGPDTAPVQEMARTAIGERQSLQLRTAQIELNTDTALSWQSGEAGMQIRLERGEVALEIPETARAVPPMLTAGAFAAALMPGAFNARFLGDVLALTVLEGEASMARRDGGTFQRAMPGERLLGTNRRIALETLSDEALDRLAAWRRGEILFQDTQLATAIVEYNRYLDRPLVILDPEVGRLRIGGRFTSVDPSGFLRALELTLGVVAVQSHEAVVLVHGA